MGIVLEDPAMRDRVGVFLSREDAGKSLASFIRESVTLTRPLVCAIPSGGVPIGLEVAGLMQIPLMLGIVRKLKIPWNPEAGFGAVTWDGRVFLNQGLVDAAGLSREEIDRAIVETRKNIRARTDLFMGSGSPPDPAHRQIILTDDGLASGYTMIAAISALRPVYPEEILVAVPTGSESATRLASRHADRVICLNIRSGPSFAVADAYRNWYDLTDGEVIGLLARARGMGLM
ncbi:MAG: phosphoribosyltransferase [Methanolinea sp.]|nr:phosphoribosyltransferase [Methanolinea sp.]